MALFEPCRCLSAAQRLSSSKTRIKTIRYEPNNRTLVNILRDSVPVKQGFRRVKHIFSRKQHTSSETKFQ